MSIFLKAKIKSQPHKEEKVKDKQKDHKVFLKDGVITYKRILTPKRSIDPMIFI